MIPDVSEEVRAEQASRGPMMESEVLVMRTLSGLRRKRALIWEPRPVRWIEAFVRHFPRTFDRVSIRAFARMQRETAEAVEASRS